MKDLRFYFSGNIDSSGNLGVTFNAKIKIQRNMDLKLLQAKLKLTGLAGKTIGYKEV